MNNNIEFEIKINDLSIMDSYEIIRIVWNGFTETSVEKGIFFS